MKDWLKEDLDIKKIESMSDKEAEEYFGLGTSDKPVEVLRRTYYYTKKAYEKEKQKKEK